MIIIQFLIQAAALAALFTYIIIIMIHAIKSYKSSQLPNTLFEPLLAIIGSLLLTIVVLSIQTIGHYLQGHSIFKLLLAPNEYNDGYFLQHKIYFAVTVLHELIIRPLWWYLCVIAIGGWLKLSLRLPQYTTYKKIFYDTLITVATLCTPIILVTYDDNVRYNISQLIRLVSVAGSAILLATALTQARKAQTAWILQVLYLISGWSVLNCTYYLFDLWQMRHQGVALHSQANTLLICITVAAQLYIIHRLLTSVDLAQQE